MPDRSKRRVLAAALALATALAFGACGGGDEQESGGGGGGSSGGAAKPVTLTVGVLPITDLAPLYLGMDQGFFEAEKLTIKPAVAEGGAAVVPAVMSGDNQIGFSNVTSLMLAKSQNLPLKPIANGVTGGSSEDDAWDALLAPKGGATDLKQLEGKKVSVNTLKNLPEVAVRNSLEKAGVDVSKVEFVEIPFPDVGAALESKRVDAAFAVEPFVGSALAAGATKLAEPFEELAPNLTIAE
jgi:NitT/TauT family transport system substrate-binding protein